MGVGASLRNQHVIIPKPFNKSLGKLWLSKGKIMGEYVQSKKNKHVEGGNYYDLYTSHKLIICGEKESTWCPRKFASFYTQHRQN